VYKLIYLLTYLLTYLPLTIGETRHDKQYSDDQLINIGCTTISTNASFDYTASAGRMELKVKFLLQHHAERFNMINYFNAVK